MNNCWNNLLVVLSLLLVAYLQGSNWKKMLSISVLIEDKRSGVNAL